MTLSLWLAFFPLGASFGLNADVKFGHNESVVSPAVSTAHGLGHPYVLPVLPPGDDVVN